MCVGTMLFYDLKTLLATDHLQTENSIVFLCLLLIYTLVVQKNDLTDQLNRHLLPGFRLDPICTSSLPPLTKNSLLFLL